MKKKFLIVLILILLGLCLTFYIINAISAKTTNEIHLEGKDTFWKASLNINLNYDSELNIRPRRDDFIIPSVIDIDIVVNNKYVYNDILKYVEDIDGSSLLGKYTVKLNSSDYFNHKTKEVHIIIKYNNESSTILLKKSDNE